METLRSLHAFLHQNPEYALGACWLFSLAVQALPTPRENGNLFYTWIFNVGHGIAANVGLLGKVKKGVDS